ncbi:MULTISPECIES: colicin-like pore-forming protein [Providencia]|uniref:colicin-like pore-forming protein n=1 Tax=Providencia TaxID=586 RepID=UPI00234B755C|nr:MULTISPECIES: colicin-like pore-forming protein [unclassified Providencia]
MSKNTMVISVDDFYDGTYQPESPPDVMVVTAPPIEGVVGPDSFIQWWNDGYVDPFNVRPRPPSPPPPPLPIQGHGKVQQPVGNSSDIASDGSGIYTVNYHGRIYDVSIDKNGRAINANFVKLDKHTLKNISSEEASSYAKSYAERSFRQWYSEKYIAPKYKFENNDQKLHDNFLKNTLKKTTSELKKEGGFFLRDTSFNIIKAFTARGMTPEVEGKILTFVDEAIASFNDKDERLRQRNSDYYTNAIKLADFTGISENAYEIGELDMINTLFAKPFIDEKYNGRTLSTLAKQGSTIEVKSRVALVKDIKNNKTTAYLVQPDGVAIGSNIPVVQAKYNKTSATPVFTFETADGKITCMRSFRQAGNYVGFEFSAHSESIKSKNDIFPEDINLNFDKKIENIKLPFEYQINDAIVVFPDGSNMNPIYIYYGYPKSRYVDELKNSERKRQEEQYDQIKTGIKATLDFYKELAEKLGVKAEKLAENLAASSKGKKIRNAEDALKVFEQYKNSLGKKYGAKDREAIAKALESRDTKLVADRFNKMSKVFYRAGKVMDYADLGNELYKAFKTDNWRPFFVKAETLIAGNTAGAATAFAFSIVLGGPVGIIGFALIMAAVGALVDEQLVEQINKILGI